MKRSGWVPLLAWFVLACNTSTDPERGSPPSPQVFVSYDSVFAGSIFANDPSAQIQDFDLEDGFLYVHPISAFGLYRYSFLDGTLEELAPYPSGDFIAAAPPYVFYEVSGNGIRRYNLTSDSTDRVVAVSDYGLQSVGGMSVYGSSLYAVARPQSSANRVLAKFDLDLNLTDTIPYGRATLHMGIDKDVVYSLNVVYDQQSVSVFLARFNLSSSSFLTDLPFPTQAWNGLRVLRDTLYFADSGKRCIMFVPLAGLAN